MNRNQSKNQLFRLLRKQAFALLLSLFLLLPALLAAGLTGVCYTVSLSSEKEVRPGDSFTVRLRLDESAYGYQGVIGYDSSVLTMTNVKPVNNGEDILNEFHVYADTGLIVVTHKSPVKNMLNVTFKVSENAKIGSSTAIHFHSGEVLNRETKETVNDVSFIVKLVNKKSSDATLASLSMKVFDDEGEQLDLPFSPAFSGRTTFYKTENAPNAYARYQIVARVNDRTAKIESKLEGSLDEGWNEITISVRAEDDTVKEYSIMVFRESIQEVSQITSDETSSEPDFPSEEPTSSEEVSSEVQNSDDQSSEEESDVFESSEESFEGSSAIESEEADDSSAGDTSQASVGPIVPYQPERRDWTGVILCIAAVGGIAIVALVVRIFILFKKKQSV